MSQQKSNLTPMIDQPLSSSLWAFALDHYQKPGVAPLLIEYQDRFAMNVNLLLWCCWCADHGRQVNDLEMRNALAIADSWSAEVTAPLRHARRALKTPQFHAFTEKDSTLYEEIKAVELAAEKQELGFYEKIGLDDNKDPASHHISALQGMTLARKNITAYVALAGIARMEGFSITLIEDIVAAILTPRDEGRTG